MSTFREKVEVRYAMAVEAEEFAQECSTKAENMLKVIRQLLNIPNRPLARPMLMDVITTAKAWQTVAKLREEDAQEILLRYFAEEVYGVRS